MSQIVLRCSLKSDKSAADLFKYFSDFTTTNEWDPNTVNTTLISGDGKVGTKYANTSTFNGRQSSLVYEVIEFQPDKLIRLRGENKTLVAIDTMSIEDKDGRRTFTYEAAFTFKGIYKVAAPLLKKAFGKLRDDAEVGLKRVL
jgi:Polyketide cyclase / dehydrase and lipid transport